MNDHSRHSDPSVTYVSESTSRRKQDSIKLQLSIIRQLCPERPTIPDRRPELSFGYFCKFQESKQKKKTLPVNTRLWLLSNGSSVMRSTNAVLHGLRY